MSSTTATTDDGRPVREDEGGWERRSSPATPDTTDGLLSAARALAPRIAELREEIERQRRLPEALVQEMRAAGLWRLTTPAAFGGHEADLPTFMRIIEEVSRLDGSVGWNLMIGASHGFITAFLPAEVARELYARFPDPIGGGTFNPRTGKAVAVEGGYRVSGRWAFGSGVQQCAFMMATCSIFDGDAPRPGPVPGVPAIVSVIFPTSDCTLIDTWHVSGLRGTGSLDYAVQDLFVPAAYTMPWLFAARPAQPGPLYSFPLIAFLSVEVAPVALGIARRAIDALLELAAAKTPTGQTSLLRERAAVQADVARAEALLRSGRAFLFQTVEEAWAKVAAGETLSLHERALLRLAAVTAAGNAAQAVDLMYNAGGATSIYESSPLERCFRDVHAVTQHIVVHPAALETAGKVFLGLEPGGGLV